MEDAERNTVVDQLDIDNVYNVMTNGPRIKLNTPPGTRNTNLIDNGQLLYFLFCNCIHTIQSLGNFNHPFF